MQRTDWLCTFDATCVGGFFGYKRYKKMKAPDRRHILGAAGASVSTPPVCGGYGDATNYTAPLPMPAPPVETRNNAALERARAANSTSTMPHV